MSQVETIARDIYDCFGEDLTVDDLENIAIIDDYEGFTVGLVNEVWDAYLELVEEYEDTDEVERDWDNDIKDYLMERA